MTGQLRQDKQQQVNSQLVAAKAQVTLARTAQNLFPWVRAALIAFTAMCGIITLTVSYAVKEYISLIW